MEKSGYHDKKISRCLCPVLEEIVKLYHSPVAEKPGEALLLQVHKALDEHLFLRVNSGKDIDGRAFFNGIYKGKHILHGFLLDNTTAYRRICYAYLGI